MKSKKKKKENFKHIFVYLEKSDCHYKLKNKLNKNYIKDLK